MRPRPFSAAWRKHWLWHPLEGALLYALCGLCAALPVDWASALGGWLGRTIGPRLGGSRRPLRNLRRCLPALGEAEHRRIVRAMWDNLGRVAAEYPHLQRLLDEPGRIDTASAEHWLNAVGPGRQILWFGGHFGNWELAGPLGVRLTPPIGFLYRPPNNRFADRLVSGIRTRLGMTLFTKSPGGARAAIRMMAGGGNFGMLIDQRMNKGIPVPFFGQPAPTNPVLAQFALRHGCVVLPVRIERTGGARFRAVCEPPLEIPRSGDREADILALMTAANAVIERWARARPEQWLWLHRRWKD